MRWRWFAVTTALFAAVSCAGDDAPDPPAGASPPLAGSRAEDRAVTIRTTGCGDASHTAGSGVIIGQANVLTAAHVVVGATDVFVDGSDEPAVVYLLDRTRDLALIKAPSVDATPVELAGIEAGEAVRVVGGAASGAVDAIVERRLVIDVDDVRSTSRSERSGFELDAAIVGGDSGAGVYDGDGRLVGVVFAVATSRTDATFAIDSAEISALLASSEAVEYRCDPMRSQLVGPGG